jgi:hypothetical protein
MVARCRRNGTTLDPFGKMAPTASFDKSMLVMD